MTNDIKTLLDLFTNQTRKEGDTLLTKVMQSGESVKRRLRDLINDPSGTFGLLATRAAEDSKSYTDLASRRDLTQQEQKRLFDQTLNIAGLAPAGMIAYHGSPHKFDKFDMSKIGTGEGNQAFGRGLYVAENPEVAKSYSNLADARGLTYVNGELANTEVNGLLGIASRDGFQTALDKINNDLLLATNKTIPKWAYKKGREQDLNGFISSKEETIKNITRWRDELQKYKDADLTNKFLYKVDIPDESIPRMLDWDKPIADQSDLVQKALSSKGGQRLLDSHEQYAGANQTTGDSFVKYLNDTYGPDGATKWLNDRQIPGIRYLDGSSRNAGQGTSNYVLFDDQLPKILERNGKPVRPAKP